MTSSGLPAPSVRKVSGLGDWLDPGFKRHVVLDVELGDGYGLPFGAVYAVDLILAQSLGSAESASLVAPGPPPVNPGGDSFMIQPENSQQRWEGGGNAGYCSALRR